MVNNDIQIRFHAYPIRIYPYCKQEHGTRVGEEHVEHVAATISSCQPERSTRPQETDLRPSLGPTKCNHPGGMVPGRKHARDGVAGPDAVPRSAGSGSAIWMYADGRRRVDPVNGAARAGGRGRGRCLACLAGKASSSVPGFAPRNGTAAPRPAGGAWGQVAGKRLVGPGP
jgi:hypothetical protein